MTRWVAFYQGKRWEDCYALTAVQARLEGVAHFQPPKEKQHLVSVMAWPQPAGMRR